MSESSDHRRALSSGELWAAMRARKETAVRSGVLRAWTTSSTVVSEGGVQFLVRKLTHLLEKDAATAAAASVGRNPFLPYERELFVCDLSPTHVCLLNKFNVVDHHLLIVTREFEEQERALNRQDFGALAACLVQLDGLAFYNAGRRAGASQPHKHLQLVIGAMGETAVRSPVEPLVLAALGRGERGLVPDLPFMHCAARFHGAHRDQQRRECGGLEQAGPPVGASELDETYRALASYCAIDPGRDPYNLLATREWMLLIPRSKQSFRTISINALGFAGSILVRTDEELELVRSTGPLEILSQVSLPRR